MIAQLGSAKSWQSADCSGSRQRWHGAGSRQAGQKLMLATSARGRHPSLPRTRCAWRRHWRIRERGRRRSWRKSAEMPRRAPGPRPRRRPDDGKGAGSSAAPFRAAALAAVAHDRLVLLGETVIGMKVDEAAAEVSLRSARSVGNICPSSMLLGPSAAWEPTTPLADARPQPGSRLAFDDPGGNRGETDAGEKPSDRSGHHS